MKTHRNALALALAIALVIAFAGIAGAQRRGMAGGGMGGMTPEQQAAMHKLHAEHAAATAGLKQQLFAKESALTGELYSEKPDEGNIEALTKEINAIHAKLYAEKVKLQRQMAREGILPRGGQGMMGGGMMGGGMGCPMMGGGGMMGGPGMRHGQVGGQAEPTAPEGDHSGHAPAPQ
jgi:zinc resistance-associated protein